MIKFKTFITERYINLIGDDPKKHEYKHEVHNLLKKSYEKIGGIHGSGFESPDDMVKKVHMWKLAKKDGKIVSAVLYKEKGGRKSVAVGTNGTDEGKSHLAHMMKHDVIGHRAYSEKSGPSLSFLKKQLPPGHLEKSAIKYHHVEKMIGEPIKKPPHDDPEVIKHPELKDHLYQRKIGDEWHTKLMLGTPGKTIKPK
jgi:hypothetical protein